MFGKALKKAFPYTVPIMAGYLFLGAAFGLLVRTQGYPVGWAAAMSLVIYSGALEYAAVPMLAQPLAPVGTFIFGLMLSARHLFYGLPMLKRYKGAGRMKPALILTLTDETFSVLSTVKVPEDVDEHKFYAAVSLLDYIYWNAGTLIGAVCGRLMTWDMTGLDFALTALFIVLFLEQMKTGIGRLSGAIGMLATLLVMLICGKERMIVISMVLIASVLLAGRYVIEGRGVAAGRANADTVNNTHTEKEKFHD